MPLPRSGRAQPGGGREAQVLVWRSLNSSRGRVKVRSVSTVRLEGASMLSLAFEPTMTREREPLQGARPRR